MSKMQYRWISNKVHDHFDGTNRVDIHNGDIIELDAEQAAFLKDRIKSLAVEEAEGVVASETETKAEAEVEIEEELEIEEEPAAEEAPKPRKGNR